MPELMADRSARKNIEMSKKENPALNNIRKY